MDKNIYFDDRELNFLILHYLSSKLPQNVCKTLEEELRNKNQLPTRFTWEGRSIPLSYTELEKRFAHVDQNFLKIVIVHFLQHRPQDISFPRVLTLLGHDYYDPLHRPEAKPEMRKEETQKISTEISLNKCQKSRKKMKVQQQQKTVTEVPRQAATITRTTENAEIQLKEQKVNGNTSTVSKKFDKLSIEEQFVLLRKFSRNRYLGAKITNVNKFNFFHVLSYTQLGAAPSSMLPPTFVYKNYHKLKTVKGHVQAAYCVTFDKTGSRIITGADDFLVKIWSTYTGDLLFTLKGHDRDITDLAINDNNTLLASGSNDNIVRVWSIERQFHPIAVLMGHTNAITSLSFCPNPKYPLLLSTSEDGTIRLWDVSDFSKEPTVLTTHELVLCHVWSTGGTKFVTGGNEGTVIVWSVDPPHAVQTLSTGMSAVTTLCWSHKGYRVAAGCRDGTTRLWGFNTTLGCWVCCNVFAVRTQRKKSSRVTMLIWSTDDKYLVTAYYNSEIRVWDTMTGELRYLLEGHKQQVFVLDAHPFDPRIVMSAGYDGKVILWDLSTGTAIKHFADSDNRLADGGFSPNGNYFVVSDTEGYWTLYGTGAGELLRKCPEEQFFQNDYAPLRRDAQGNVIDDATQIAPHLLPRGVLCNQYMHPYIDQPSAVAYDTPLRLSSEELETNHLRSIAFAEAEKQLPSVVDTERIPTETLQFSFEPTDIMNENFEDEIVVESNDEEFRIDEDEEEDDDDVEDDTDDEDDINDESEDSYSEPQSESTLRSVRLRPRLQRRSSQRRRRSERLNPPTETHPNVSMRLRRRRGVIQSNRNISTSETRRIVTLRDLENNRRRIPTRSQSAQRKRQKKNVITLNNLQQSPEGEEKTTKNLLDEGNEEEFVLENEDEDEYRVEEDNEEDASASLTFEDSNSEMNEKIESDSATRRRSQRLHSVVQSQQKDKSLRRGESETVPPSTSSSVSTATPTTTTTTTVQQLRSKRAKQKQKKEKKLKQTKRIYPPWIRQTFPSYLIGFYCPQLGDKVVFFRRGYDAYLEHFTEFRESLLPPEIPDIVYCTVTDLKYHVEPFIHCEIALRTLLPKIHISNIANDSFNEQHTHNGNSHNEVDTKDCKWDLTQSEKTAEERLNYYNSVLGDVQYDFTVRYHACELPDFIVLASRFHQSLKVKWQPGLTFAIWLFSNVQQNATDERGGHWYEGTVIDVRPALYAVPLSSISNNTNNNNKSTETKKEHCKWLLSPYEMLTVKWSLHTEEQEESQISPWEVIYTDSDLKPLQTLTIEALDPQLAEKICSSIQENILDSGNEEYDPFIVPVDIDTYSDYPQFVPYPIDISTICDRLRNNFYRTIQHLKYEVFLLKENAILYNPPDHPIIEWSKKISNKILEIIDNCLLLFKNSQNTTNNDSKFNNILADNSDVGIIEWVLSERPFRQMIARNERSSRSDPTHKIESPLYVISQQQQQQSISSIIAKHTHTED